MTLILTFYEGKISMAMEGQCKGKIYKALQKRRNIRQGENNYNCGSNSRYQNMYNGRVWMYNNNSIKFVFSLGQVWEKTCVGLTNGSCGEVHSEQHPQM